MLNFENSEFGEFIPLKGFFKSKGPRPSPPKEQIVDGDVHALLPPNWKQIARDLKLPLRSIRKYFVTKFLFDIREMKYDYVLLWQLLELIPESLPYRVLSFPEYDRKKGKDGEEKSLKEDIFFSRILYLLLTTFLEREALLITREERKLLLEYLEELGYSQFGLLRGYRGQKKFYDPMILRTLPRKPSRRKVKNSRRRRSSEDRSGKPSPYKGASPRWEKMPSFEIQRVQLIENSPRIIKKKIFDPYQSQPPLRYTKIKLTWSMVRTELGRE